MENLRFLADTDGIFLRGEVWRLGGTDSGLVACGRAKVLHRLRHGAYVP